MKKSIVIFLMLFILIGYSISLPQEYTIPSKKYFVSASEIDSKSQMFIDASLEFGVPASILMAMAIEETSFGTKGVATSKNNWFGMEKGSLYPTDPSYTGRFEVYPDAATSIRDAARLVGSPVSSYKATNIIINNGGLSNSYSDIARSITSHWCVNEPGAPCSYDAQTLLNDIEKFGLKKYDTALSNLSVKELKDILDKYYGPNAIAIPGFDKAVTNWNGIYTVPDISNNTYNILYFNTTYYGDITQGYIYKKYHQEPLWEELALDTDYQKVTHIIGNIFLQGEKLYGDGELHIGDFLFNGSDQYAPIGEIIIEGGEFSGSPLPMGSYTCTSGFGYRGNIGLAGASKNHKAIDLAVPVGTPVYTVGAGTVSYSGSLGSCGNAIKIEHGNGLQTRYCHLSTLNVKVGQTVQSGDVIALSGNTGNSTGPHLDFQVNQNGTAVDPRSVIDALKGLKCTNGL